ncbi:MAG: carboxypeptidase regulatory-like domain-containing protein, partial [Planctomycetota bacterium]
AIGCGNWNMREGNKELEIKLGPPKELAGIVVDESDKPVSDAQVSISVLKIGEGDQQRGLAGSIASKLFTVNTDAEGKFAFTGIPADATVEFLVKKAGRATVSTYQRPRSANEKLNFVPGQTDIKLVQMVEARIEGTVVEKDTGKPVSSVEVTARNERDISYFRQKPVVSKEDGTFSIGALRSEKYTLELMQPSDGLTDLVAKPVEVMNETGETKSGLKIEVTKGGILEVVVTDASSQKPLEKASVNVRDEQNNRFYGGSDTNGIARIRLMPGEYQISGVYKADYTSENRSEAITIENDKTARIEWQLTIQPKITGTVQDETGKPVGDVKVGILPGGGRDFKANVEGKFEVSWDPRAWGPEETAYILIARHEQRNLAAAVEIYGDTKTIDIRLKPGVIFTGKVVDPNGKGIAGATVMPMLRMSNWGSSMGRPQPKTDAEGNFEIKAIPAEHKYGVYARAEGYGENDVEVYSDDAVDNRLNVGVLTLAVANLSVSGVVVDVDDKPVANARVYCSGDGQQYRDTQADAYGKFKLENICAGMVRISANTSGRTRLYGNVETEGGATDVKIVLSERPSSTRYIPKQPPSLVGKPLPELSDLKIELSPIDTNDKMILVCFWDMDQRPSRHCIIQLAKQTEQLKQEGVIIVAVHASKVDENIFNEWIKKYNIPFPVGIIEGDTEKVSFAWGVKALPWLILTDRQHIVSVEGFSIRELDEKIAEAVPRKE